MERKIVQTADGSSTLRIPEWEEQYHSMHGALRESRHVFVQHGLDAAEGNRLRILEMGFGTGLNTLLTCLRTRKTQKEVSYTALEAFPLHTSEWEALNYPDMIEEDGAGALYRDLHEHPWGGMQPLRPGFNLCKLQVDLLDFRVDSAGNPPGLDEAYDLIYFDAFGARVQPELWTEEVFFEMFRASAPGGILVTYAAKGSVRRAMAAVGFQVERLPGPPGKREMLRARRPA